MCLYFSSLSQKKREIKKKSRAFNMLPFPSHLSISVLLRPRLWCACPCRILAQAWWSVDSARATDTQREVRRQGEGASTWTSWVWWFLSSSVTRWARESCLQISNRTNLSLLPGGGLAVKLTSQTPSLWLENHFKHQCYKASEKKP